MEFFEVVRQRRSVRKYTAEAIPAEVVQKCLDAALLAPNSSNLQTWEFYWVRDPQKKKSLVEACLSQPAAATAPELVVAVARRDTWRRNQKMMIEALSTNGKLPKGADTYYRKLIPFAYNQGLFGEFGLLKKIALNTAGLFRPTPRGPSSLAELDQVLIKSTALACENLMLAAVAQGYACCPMEGFDEARVKKLLQLPCSASKIVMVISIGKPDPAGIYGKQMRFDRNMFVFEV